VRAHFFETGVFVSKKAILALQDGTVFSGSSIGADGLSSGEVVFNTAMTGYQERPVTRRFSPIPLIVSN
jgi:hypothetical protein